MLCLPSCWHHLAGPSRALTLVPFCTPRASPPKPSEVLALQNCALSFQTVQLFPCFQAPQSSAASCSNFLCINSLSPHWFPVTPVTNGHKLSDLKTTQNRDFPGSPVVKVPCFQCRGYGFDPWSEKGGHQGSILSAY